MVIFASAVRPPRRNDSLTTVPTLAGPSARSSACTLCTGSPFQATITSP